MQVDHQTDFSGGMVDHISPDRIPANAYAFGQNLEVRNGLVRARRGTREVWWSPKHEAWELKGATIYRSSGGGEYLVMVCETLGKPVPHILTLNSFEEAYASVFTDAEPEEGSIIQDIGIGQEIVSVRFCQHYGRLYLLRGDKTFYWNGSAEDERYVFQEDTFFPKADYALSAYGRLWAVHDGEDGTYDTLLISDIYFGGDYPTDDAGEVQSIWDSIRRSWRIGAGRNERILSLVDIGSGKIAIIKENSLWVLHECKGDLTGLWMEEVDNTNGCIGFDASARVGSDVWYLSRDGVRSAGVTAENYARAVNAPVSKAIEVFVREYANLNSRLVQDAMGVVYDNYVFFSFPYGGGGEVNSLLVYDLLNQSWTGVWTGLPCTRLLVSQTAWGSQRLLLFSALDKEKRARVTVSMLENSTVVETADSENAFDCVLMTRAYGCQDGYSVKRFLRCSIDSAANDSVISVLAKPYDSPNERHCLTKHIETRGWYILLPEEGLVFPDANWELVFASQKFLPVAYYTGIVAKAMQLRITFRGELQLGYVDVQAQASGDVHGRQI